MTYVLVGGVIVVWCCYCFFGLLFVLVVLFLVLDYLLFLLVILFEFGVFIVSVCCTATNVGSWRNLMFYFLCGYFGHVSIFYRIFPHVSAPNLHLRRANTIPTVGHLSL